MNPFRASRVGGWLLAGLLAAGGCASPSAEDADRAAQRQAWDGLSPVQKFADFNLWLVELAAYGLCESGASYKP